jgi:hypothetical protein
MSSQFQPSSASGSNALRLFIPPVSNNITIFKNDYPLSAC